MGFRANELTNWNGLSISYDSNGNMLSDGSNAFAWNARNQVATLNGVSLQYDAAGRRIKNVAGKSFLYDGENSTQELSGSTVTANIWTGGLDEFFQRTDSNGTVVPITDALGSVIALADSSGNVQTSYSYDPFGNTTVSGAASSNPSQYTGRENEGNGLYFYRNRYYSPLLGRFISEDSLGFAGGDDNLSAYVFDAPTNFIDPMGTNALPSAATAAKQAAKSGWQLIQGGKAPLVTMPQSAGDWGLAGFLAGFDIFVGYEDYQAIHAFNAENAAYDQESQAMHQMNQAFMAHPRPNPVLAGRYTPEQQRQKRI